MVGTNTSYWYKLATRDQVRVNSKADDSPCCGLPVFLLRGQTPCRLPGSHAKGTEDDGRVKPRKPPTCEGSPESLAQRRKDAEVWGQSEMLERSHTESTESAEDRITVF